MTTSINLRWVGAGAFEAPLARAWRSHHHHHHRFHSSQDVWLSVVTRTRITATAAPPAFVHLLQSSQDSRDVSKSVMLVSTDCAL